MNGPLINCCDENSTTTRYVECSAHHPMKTHMGARKAGSSGISSRPSLREDVNLPETFKPLARIPCENVLPEPSSRPRERPKSRRKTFGTQFRCQPYGADRQFEECLQRSTIPAPRTRRPFSTGNTTKVSPRVHNS